MQTRIVRSSPSTCSTVERQTRYAVIQIFVSLCQRCLILLRHGALQRAERLTWPIRQSECCNGIICHRHWAPRVTASSDVTPWRSLGQSGELSRVNTCQTRDKWLPISDDGEYCRSCLDMNLTSFVFRRWIILSFYKERLALSATWESKKDMRMHD